jgi:hypothetical protein
MMNVGGLENEINGRGNPLRWPRDTIYPQKLALTSPTNGGRSVGIVLLLTEATELCSYVVLTAKYHQLWYTTGYKHWRLCSWTKFLEENKSLTFDYNYILIDLRSSVLVFYVK